MSDLALGIDVGTSGVRVAAIDQAGHVAAFTASTMPAPLYVLWGDEYHKLHPETQLRYLAVGTSESANRVLSGSGGDLGGGDAPIPEKQLKEAAHAAVQLVAPRNTPVSPGL